MIITTTGASGEIPSVPATIAAGAIATDAIDAAAIKTDAVTEIQSGLSTLTAAGIRTAVGLGSANLDTQLGAIDDYIDTEVAAIKAKTDNLPSDPADASDILTATNAIAAAIAALSIPTAIQNADALLNRDVSNTEGTAAVHSLTSVILKLVSRFVATTGRTYRTNGSTVHMTQTPVSDSAADPITELGVGA